MNVSAALTDCRHAHETACAEPSPWNVARYDRALYVYVGVARKRIVNLWWVAALGGAATATLNLFVGFSTPTVGAVLLVWAAGISVPITRTVGQRRRAVASADGCRAAFARWTSSPPNDC